MRRRETPEPGNREDMHYTFSQSLIFLARRWRNLMNHELSSVGQSQARWGTLYWIDVYGDSLNQTELADRIGVEQQTLGRVLRDLQSEGLIERVPSPHDQRAKVIRLTRAADPVMRQIAAIQEDGAQEAAAEHLSRAPGCQYVSVRGDSGQHGRALRRSGSRGRAQLARPLQPADRECTQGKDRGKHGQ